MAVPLVYKGPRCQPIPDNRRSMTLSQIKSGCEGKAIRIVIVGTPFDLPRQVLTSPSHDRADQRCEREVFTCQRGWKTSLGASGSSQARRKLRVPSGTPVQTSGGDRLSPSQVYSFGISPPCRNAALVNLKGMSASAIRHGHFVKFANSRARRAKTTLTQINARQFVSGLKARLIAPPHGETRMPELPDVEAFKRVLAKNALDKTIKTVAVSDRRICSSLRSAVQAIQNLMSGIQSY